VVGVARAAAADKKVAPVAVKAEVVARRVVAAVVGAARVDRGAAEGVVRAAGAAVAGRADRAAAAAVRKAEAVAAALREVVRDPAAVDPVAVVAARRAEAVGVEVAAAKAVAVVRKAGKAGKAEAVVVGEVVKVEVAAGGIVRSDRGLFQERGVPSLHQGEWGRCRIRTYATIASGLVLLPPRRGRYSRATSAGAPNEREARSRRETQARACRSLSRA
jgi:hypothetical protein